MQTKQIIFEEDARAKLKNGIDILSHAVVSTLGPCGKNVIIERESGTPHSTKDGVTVANSIQLKDPVENLGAQIVREAASQTADAAGDGTTTATVLAQAIIKEGLKFVVAGSNSIELKRGMDVMVKEVTKALKEISKDVSADIEIAQVGTVSANNDKDIGNLIAEAMKKVGQDGVITVEESRTSETTMETVEGLQFDRGYLSPYFVTNNQLMMTQMEDAYILLYDKKINTAKSLVKLLEQCIAKNKPLLIIADDIEGEALATLIVNKARGTVQVCGVKAPEFGDRKKLMLDDIAVITGGHVISPDKGQKLENVTLDQLGRARIVTITSKQTTIVDGKGEEAKILARIEEIKDQIAKADSNYDIEKLQQRLAKMTGGVAILNIGADSEIEMKEKKDRIEDALNATKAAIEEGIIPGGGVTFMRIYDLLSKRKNIKFDNEDQRLGGQIVLESIKYPFNKIMENAGLNGEAIWISIRNSKKGFDARNNVIVDMYNAGIIDPTKVARIALEKAASVAGQLLITNTVISIDPDSKKDEPNYGMQY